MVTEKILDRASAGERLERVEILRLFEHGNLLELGQGDRLDGAPVFRGTTTARGWFRKGPFSVWAITATTLSTPASGDLSR